MKFILGKKIEMSQIFKDDKVVPITLISAGPCFITQIKTKEKDNYNAIQIGFEKIIKKNKIKKTMKGKEYRYLKEFAITEAQKVKEAQETKIGDKIDAAVFKEGDKVKISGISKGKGFQGAVKKWGFSGKDATHGVKHTHRTLGSVGATGPGRVFKGKKMAGRMGYQRITVKKVEIIKIDPEDNLLVVKGAVPGRRGTLLEIKQ